MKRILFVALFFQLFSSAFSNEAYQDGFQFSGLEKESPKSSITKIDSSLNRIEIYDPASSTNYFGLGFPGAASRTILLNENREIGICPIFNSFKPFLMQVGSQAELNLKKPLTQIEYVIFPSIRTEQYLDLFHSRNITKNSNIGIKLRKIKSNGYYLQQGSNITNVLTYFDANSKNNRYHLSAGFFYNGLISVENGGVVNDSIDYGSRSISLQSLPVYLKDAKNRISLLGGNISQSFDFGTYTETIVDSVNSIKTFRPSSRINLHFNYKMHATTYIDDFPISGYYEKIYRDSVDTFDKFSYESFASELSYSLLAENSSKKKRLFVSCLGFRNEMSFLKHRELDKPFNNTSAFLSFGSSDKTLNRFGLNSSYFLSGYNQSNYLVNALIGRKFCDSTKYEFTADLLAFLGSSTPEYVYQNYFSNHFRWQNNFTTIFSKGAAFHLLSKQLFNVKFNYVQLQNLTFMDSLSTPSQLNNSVNYYTGGFEKLIKLGSFYFNVNIVYQKVVRGRDVFGLPELFTRNSIYWANSVFKKAMDLQIGFDLLYATEYLGLAYQPALNTFYYQNKKKVGGYPAIDFFINFKIKQVRLFFKVDHLNYGLSSGIYAYTPNYLLPGRTFRFGLSWLFLN